VALAITGTLILLPGTHAASARAEAEERIRALFTDPSTVPSISPLQIGEDVPRDRLTAAVMAVRGIKRVEWIGPASDVAVPEDGLATLESLTLETSEAEES
jgi:phage-related baseplate assembly protein